MRNSILITALALLLLSCSAKLNAQGTAINANGANPDNSAILDAASTTKGFLMPRMTTTERNNIASPAQSLLIFNTTTTCFEYHYSGVWYSMSCTCVVPLAPTSNTATNVTDTSFTANWTASSGSATYYLDVATDAAFTGFVSGYNNRNVGGVTTCSVTGLTCNTSYFYRVRANNSCGTSANSNSISATTLICGISQTQCGISFTYYEVTSAGLVWLDRNLAASQVASSGTDYNSYGSLFQWGRLADGHECINWTSSTNGTPVNGTTVILSNDDVPPNSLFILCNPNPQDWRVGQNNSLWQGVSGINNPCPSGFRLPTSTELNTEFGSWGSQNAAGAYNSPLKFTVGGNRGYDNGALNNVGNGGYCWSSTVSGIYATGLAFYTGSANIGNYYRATGLPVRCIKN